MRHLVPTVYKIVIRYICVSLVHWLGTATCKTVQYLQCSLVVKIQEECNGLEM